AAWAIPPGGTVLRNPCDQRFRQAGRDGPRVTVESASLLFITKMLQESDFIAVVATEIANYYAKHGMVSIVPIDLPCEMEPFGLVLRKDRLLSPAATKVLTALRQTASAVYGRSEEHTSELQSRETIVCRLLLEKKNKRW